MFFNRQKKHPRHDRLRATPLHLAAAFGCQRVAEAESVFVFRKSFPHPVFDIFFCSSGWKSLKRHQNKVQTPIKTRIIWVPRLYSFWKFVILFDIHVYAYSECMYVLAIHGIYTVDSSARILSWHSLPNRTGAAANCPGKDPGQCGDCSHLSIWRIIPGLVSG